MTPAPDMLQSPSDAPTHRPLVGAQTLLETLWPVERDRPSLRWLRKQTATRAIPFMKCGHLVFFDVDAVRRAFDRRFTIQPRS